MLKPRDPPPSYQASGGEEPIGHIVSRLLDEGRGYAKAEARLLKAIASERARALRLPVALLALAFLFVQGAVSILCVAGFLALLEVVGPMLAGLIAFVAALAVAAGLVMAAIPTIRGIGR